MKKLLAIVMALMLIAGVATVFASCANDQKSTESESASESASETASETESESASETEKKVLVMATNAYFKPYEYYEGDKIVGIDAEIAAAIGEKLGVTVEISDMAFDSIITAVSSGSVDFGMAGMTVNEERKQSVDFTISYANGVQAIIVKEGSPITHVDDLYADGASYKIGVQLGTTGDTYATDDFGSENVVSYPNGNEAVTALLAGDVDCVIIDNEPAKAFVAANEGLKVLDTTYADEDYAICVKKGNTELLEKLNEAIRALVADGTIDAIIDKYIK